MYSKACPLNHDLVLWVQLQINIMATKYLNASQFIEYLKDHWTHKATMWCVGNRNIPHVRQDTNVAMESFHSNMKRILLLSREQCTRRRLDWLIFHLVGNVLPHHWYNVQCKLFGYVGNKKQEGIIALVVLKAQDIPNSNGLLCIDGEDIAYVASINHTPKV